MKGLILVYLLTAAGAIGGLRYPLFGLQVYVGLAILRPQFIFSFAGDMSRLSFYVGVAVLVGWALQGFGSWRFGRARAVAIILFAYVFWHILSSTQALEPSRAYPSLWELGKFVLPVLVGLTLMKGARDWRPMLWTIVLAQGYVSFEMHVNYLLKGRNSAAEGFGGMDNNSFAISLVTVLGPAIALMISSRTWYARAVAGAAAALILHTVLLTFSRGGLVGLLAVGVTAFVMMPKRPKYLGALLLTGLIAMRFVGPQLADRYATILAPAESRDASAESRVDLWLDCLEVIGQYPVFGVGPANWRVIASSYGWPEGKSAHSVWMETAAETGVPGALLLFLFFAIAGFRLWPVARSRLTEENRLEVIIASGVVLAIVGFAVSGQFVSIPALEVPYYLTMVGAAVLKRVGTETTAAAPQAVTNAGYASPAFGLPPSGTFAGPVSRPRFTR